MQCCNVLQAVVAILPSSKCLPEGVKATCSHFSSDAYVQMALHGYSLRKSFTTACQLLHRHKRRMRDCQGSACTAVLPGKVSSICHATAMIPDFMLLTLQSAPLKHKQQHASVPLKRAQQRPSGVLKLIWQCTSALLNHAKQRCLTTVGDTAAHICATAVDTASKPMCFKHVIKSILCHFVKNLPENCSSVVRLLLPWALAVQTAVLIGRIL